MKKITLFFVAFMVTILGFAQTETITSFTQTSGDYPAFSFECFKNDAGSNPAVYSNNIRLYQSSTGHGGSIKVTAKDGFEITSVTFNCSSSYNGPADYYLNGNTTASGNFDDDGGNYEITSIQASSVELVANGSSKSHRIYLSGMSVTYQSSVVSNFTMTATVNDANLGSVSLQGTMATATVNAGSRYATPAYTLTPADAATITKTGDVFTATDLTADCALQINLEAIPMYTATFDAGTGAANPAALTETLGGAGVVLPSVTSTVTDYTFVGWSTTSVSKTLVKPEIFAAGETYMMTADVTLYAVYKKTTSSGSDVTTTITDFGSGSYAWKDVTADGLAFKGFYYVTGGKMQINTSKTARIFYNVDAIEGLKSIELTTTASGSMTQMNVYQSTSVMDVYDAAWVPVGSVAKDATASVAFAADGGSYFAISPDTGYGQVSSLTLTYEGTSTTYDSNPEEGGVVVDVPTFTLDAGTYTSAQTTQLTIPANTSVYYTIDGTDPTAASTAYVAGTDIALNETTTIKAIAIDANDNASVIVSRTYTINIPKTVATIAEYLALDESVRAAENYTFTCDITVTFISGNNFYVTDGTSYLHGYDYDFSSTYVQGDVLTGFNGTWNDRYHNIGNVVDSKITSVSGSYVIPVVTTLDNSYIDALVKLNQVLVSNDDVNMPNITIGGNVYNIDNSKFSATVTFEDQKNYDITAIYGEETDDQGTYFMLYTVEAVQSAVQPTSCDITEINGVEFNGTVISNPNGVAIAVYTANGKLIQQSTTSIDMTQQPKGVYMVLTPAGTIKIAK